MGSKGLDEDNNEDGDFTQNEPEEAISMAKKSLENINNNIDAINIAADETAPLKKSDGGSDDVFSLRHLHFVYENIAHQINREDQLIFSRIRLLLLAMGGATAFALAATTLGEGIKPFYRHGIIFIAGLGTIIIAFATYLSVDAAQVQLKFLRERYVSVENFLCHLNCVDELIFPRPFGDRLSHNMGKLPTYVIPVLCGLIGLVLVIVALLPTEVSSPEEVIDQASYEPCPLAMFIRPCPVSTKQ